MAERVAMTSPASAGSVLVPVALVGRYKAQGWAIVVAAPEPVEVEPERRKPGRPKKK